MSAGRSKSFEHRLNRRAIAAGLFGAPLLGGCSSFIEDLFSSCPDQPSGVDWIVDVAHPVFFGAEAAAGSPRPMTIYYPSASPRAGALLQPCLQKWPIVLFLHGMPPIQGRPTSPWASVWTRLPQTIARCGYVVAVPSHNAQEIESNPAATISAAMADIEWVRSSWGGSPWVDKRANSTTLAGHSYGALIAAHTAAQHEVGALVSLSGPYIQDGASKQALKQVTAPSFFMWGGGDASTSLFGNLDEVGFWANQLTQTRYAAVYEGEHFDYVDAVHTGGAERGPCAHIGAVCADLAALFIASNIASLTRVGVGLHEPQVTLTPQQQLFAEGHLQGFDQFTGPGCRMTLRWVAHGETGGRQFGLP